LHRSVAVVLAAGVAATAVHAQDAVAIAKRRNTMMAFGKAVRLPNAMMRGDVGFDAAKLRASLKTIQDTAIKGKTVFPDNSKVGDTEALPAAFERKDDLFARFDALAAATRAAADSIKDEAALKQDWPKILSACTSCHRQYVKPR
jgi:cytochrome c556